MTWLLLIAAAVALAVFQQKSEGRIVQTAQNGDGTWRYIIWPNANANVELHSDGPFASELAARAAGLAWLATGPVPQPIDVPAPPPGQQGGGAPTVPYLLVSSQGIDGSAIVEGDRVRWRAGLESDTAGSVISANATLLARMDSNSPANAPVNLSLVRGDGSTVRARVSRQIGQPAQVWVWSVSTPPAVAGGVGSSTTQPAWRANNRLAAMRGALSTLQDM